MVFGLGKKKQDDEGDEEGGDEGADAGEEGGEAADKGKGEAKGSGGVNNMKSGDYMIHVFLEKIKEINMPEGCDTVDPMLIVECCGLKTYSSAKDDVGPLGEIPYSEHLFLEPRGVDKKEAENGKIMLKLVDKGMFKDVLIGQFEFDLSFIYLKDKHLLLHKWLALSNPNGDDYAKIQCFMKVSIAVAFEGDEQVQIEDDTALDEDPDVIMSPALNPKFYQVKIRLYQGQDLPAMDSGIGFLSKDKIDAYMKLDFKGKKYKTQVITQNTGEAPINWNKEFWLPCQLPVAAPQIPVRLMDEDDIGSDELAATLMFYTKEIVESSTIIGPGGYFCWKNLYGSPLNQKNSKEKRLMNENPEFASQWKGRILCQVLCEETEKPLAKVVDISEEDIKAAEPYTQNKKFQIMCQIGQAVGLPTSNKYKIKVTVGGKEIDFDPQDQKKSSTYKRYNKIGPIEFMAPYVNVSDMGNVIVQLIDDKSPVCYFKAHIDEFTKTTDPERLEWYQFVPDGCVKKVTHPYEVGQFSMKLSVTDDPNLDLSTQKHWKKKFPKRMMPVKIRAYIYQARDLPAADAEGTSDPFVKVWDVEATKSKIKRTQVVEDNCNPLFYETIELSYEVDDMDDLYTYPPFIFDIFDYDDDLFDSTPDYLCRCVVEPEECAIKMQPDFEKCKAHQQESCATCALLLEEIPDHPKWHPCFFSPGTAKCGELLVSFSVAADDFKFGVSDPKEVDLASKIEKREFGVSMNILGLRNLASPGILPVKKAFIKFNIKSLVEPNGPSLKNIQTVPAQSGANPTLNTTMKFTIPLPTDPLYCPRLACTAYDCIFAGWSQPVIGVFTLPVGELIHELADERKRETEEIADINKAIEEMIDGDYNLQSYQINTLQNNTEQDQSLQQSERGSMSMRSDQKLLAQKKRKAGKKLGDMENSKDLGEQFDANEDEGELDALAQREEQKLSIKKKKDAIMKKGELGMVSPRMGGPAMSPRNLKGSDRGNSSLGSRQGSEKVSKVELKSQIAEQLALENRLKEDDVARARGDMIRAGDDVSKIIVDPKYKLDERLKIDREYGEPSKELYIGLGWDETKDEGKKHYRRYYNTELEKVKEIFPVETPFNSYKLKKGQARGTSGGLFSSGKKDASGQASTEQCVGIFKGILEVENKQDKENYVKVKNDLINTLKDHINQLSLKILKKVFLMDITNLSSPSEREQFEQIANSLGIGHLNISRGLNNLNSDEILKSALLRSEKCIIRFYAVEGFDMSSRDNGSASDTFLALECNGSKFNERDIYQLDEPNPKFYKSYDFEGVFPGCSPLQIEVWDYDMIFGDELVGTTYIDLEDRYFTLDWMAMKDKPIEYRSLYHPSSNMGQGVIKCWLEINPVNVDPEDQAKVWDITPKPAYPLEVRICVLNCKDIPMMDAEGTCDAFFRGFFDTGEEVQETDTHFRNSDGKPDFQYRMVFKVQQPKKVTKFSLQGYDRDFFKSNDMFGEATVELADIMEDVSLIKTPLSLNMKYFVDVLKPKHPNLKMEFDKEDPAKFWLTLYAKDKKGKRVKRGQIGMKIDVYPQFTAEKNPVGKARDSPNNNPTLPAPEGRLELSMNPFKMLSQLIGPALKRKILIYTCLAACCALLVMMAPMIISNLIVNLL